MGGEKNRFRLGGLPPQRAKARPFRDAARKCRAKIHSFRKQNRIDDEPSDPAAKVLAGDVVNPEVLPGIDAA
jgi:hypothetical protein